MVEDVVAGCAGVAQHCASALARQRLWHGYVHSAVVVAARWPRAVCVLCGVLPVAAAVLPQGPCRIFRHRILSSLIGHVLQQSVITSIRYRICLLSSCLLRDAVQKVDEWDLSEEVELVPCDLLLFLYCAACTAVSLWARRMPPLVHGLPAWLRRPALMKIVLIAPRMAPFQVMVVSRQGPCFQPLSHILHHNIIMLFRMVPFVHCHTGSAMQEQEQVMWDQFDLFRHVPFVHFLEGHGQ